MPQSLQRLALFVLLALFSACTQVPARPPVILNEQKVREAAQRDSVPPVSELPPWQSLRGLVPLQNSSDRERELARAVVLVEQDESMGTGFFISPDGLLLTNNHVLPAEACAAERCAGIRLIRDFWSGGEKEVFTDFHILAFSPAVVVDPGAFVPGGSDVTLVRVKLPPGRTVPYIPLDTTDLNTVQQPRRLNLRAIGHPLSAASHSVRLRLNQVHSMGQRQVELFHLTSMVVPGSSGSPIVNLETGRALGIVHSIASRTEQTALLDADGHPRGHSTFGSSARQILRDLEEALPGLNRALVGNRPAQEAAALADALTLVERFTRPGLPYPWQVWAQPLSVRDDILSFVSRDSRRPVLTGMIRTTDLSGGQYFRRFLYHTVPEDDAARLADLESLLSDGGTPEARVEFADALLQTAAGAGWGTGLPADAVRRLVERLNSDTSDRGPLLALALAELSGLESRNAAGQPIHCAELIESSGTPVTTQAAHLVQICQTDRFSDGSSVLDRLEAELTRVRQLPAEENPEDENSLHLDLTHGEIGPVAWRQSQLAVVQLAATRLLTPEQRVQSARILEILKQGAPHFGQRMGLERTVLLVADERLSYRPYGPTYRVLPATERLELEVQAELDSYLAERRSQQATECSGLVELDPPECLPLPQEEPNLRE